MDTDHSDPLTTLSDPTVTGRSRYKPNPATGKPRHREWRPALWSVYTHSSGPPLHLHSQLWATPSTPTAPGHSSTPTALGPLVYTHSPGPLRLHPRPWATPLTYTHSPGPLHLHPQLRATPSTPRAPATPSTPTTPGHSDAAGVRGLQSGDGASSGQQEGRPFQGGRWKEPRDGAQGGGPGGAGTPPRTGAGLPLPTHGGGFGSGCGRPAPPAASSPYPLPPYALHPEGKRNRVWCPNRTRSPPSPPIGRSGQAGLAGAQLHPAVLEVPGVPVALLSCWNLALFPGGPSRVTARPPPPTSSCLPPQQSLLWKFRFPLVTVT
ncbi:hypothetical protein Celaphus_00017294 [Cervus elaphus hippelaphus]|uniref:Uncharacterized protein n=1 Tax=Cervus elaphus hippelaphus TaxID=46360 RepID=A0A212D618_CEREH|nr:hypothetical protein Celaphus_00017294 [Cervus elaphus hippelaphus]